MISLYFDAEETHPALMYVSGTCYIALHYDINDLL